MGKNIKEEITNMELVKPFGKKVLCLLWLALNLFEC